MKLPNDPKDFTFSIHTLDVSRFIIGYYALERIILSSNSYRGEV